MRTILKIAGHELKLMFCSPVAWLVLVVFLYQFGSTFAAAMSFPPDALRNYFGYTNWMYSGNVLPNLDSKLYLYIPLLTMGLMSQELSTGNIKLLFSAPVKTRNIVLGKYTGIMFYWMIIMTLFSLYALSPYFIIKDLDFGIVLPGIFAAFLLACTYSAIGLFMSCLTTYQIIAALGTLTTLAALNYIGGMWQAIPVMKDIANFLHMAGHAENMNAGFIKSNDILYFIIITVLFLGLAIFYLEDTIHFRPKASKVKRYVLFTALMLGLGCIFSMRSMTLYFDTTAIKFNTVSTSSQEVLKKLKGPVKITTYSNLMTLEVPGAAENRKRDFRFWEPYLRFMPDAELRYVNYYDQDEKEPYYISAARLDSTANQYAAGHGWYIDDFLTPKQIRKVLDTKAENFNLVRTVEFGSRKRFIRMFNDVIRVPTQKEIMTAFNGMLTDYVNVAVLTGHYERGIEENEERAYKHALNEKTGRTSLINIGFDFRSVSIKDSLPMDVDALVIAEPLTAYSTAELDKIKQYIDHGGNLLVTGGPKSQDMLNPLLASLHIQMMKGQVVQYNKDFSKDMVFTQTPLREGGDPYPFQFPVPLAMPGVVGLKYEANADFKVEEAVVTDEKTTWNEMGEISPDTAVMRYNPEQGEIHQELPVALTLTRNVGKKQQKVMVVGCGGFMSNEQLDLLFQVPTAHLEFTNAIFKWFGNGTYPITVTPLERSKDIELKITKEKIEKLQPLYTWLLPVLLILSGVIFLLRRRRK